MKQGSEIWLGLGYLCRQLNQSVGLGEVWASVQHQGSSAPQRHRADTACQETGKKPKGENDEVGRAVSLG